MKMTRTHMARTEGFTIIEALIVVAVFATVIAMAFPNFTTFFEIQKEKSEEVMLSDIRKTLDIYIKAQKQLPEEATWAEDLSEYSDYNESQIENDVWGKPRVYKKVSNDITFRDADVTVDYAIVYSYGRNECYGVGCDAGVDLLPSSAFDDASDYQVIEAETGDFLTKYSGYQVMVDSYNTTVERMTKISSALSTYAFSMLDKDIENSVANVENFIYYPPSIVSGDSTNNYAASVKTDLSSFGTIGYATSDSTRRNSMRILMRILGLPEDYCCSAMELGSDGEPYPFFYYSNPRPRVGTTSCGTRPTGTSRRKLPPRITLDNVGNSCG